MVRIGGKYRFGKGCVYKPTSYTDQIGICIAKDLNGSYLIDFGTDVGGHTGDGLTKLGHGWFAAASWLEEVKSFKGNL